MRKRIRSLVDGAFSDMKMSAANLALRDELLANAFARYEDAVGQGRSEEEAFEEVASSLEDVQSLLEEMKRMDDLEPRVEEEKEIPELKTGTEEEEPAAQKSDLSEALNKAFSALGDFSQAIVPEAKKFAKEMDGVTGGVLGKLGRAAKKGMRDAQKAAGDMLDKLSGEHGELVFDFGKREDTPCEPEEGFEAAEGEPIILDDGEIDEEALSRAVEEAEREVKAVLHEVEHTAGYSVTDEEKDAE